MGMMRFHAGRMILNQQDRVWYLRIKLGSTADKQFKASLETTSAEEAIFKAERIYTDMKRQLSKKAEQKPLCWQCIHWEALPARCGFGWPEASQTGGRFAAQCSVFKACPTRQ